MNAPALTLAVPVVLAMLAIAMLCCLWRAVVGPALTDRIIALDTLYINALAFLVVLGIQHDTSAHFEVALVIAMLGFVGTVVLAKYSLRGDVIE